MIKLRIKTEEEFIRDFGKNYRNIVKGSFPKGMTYLCGQEIPREHMKDALRVWENKKTSFCINANDTSHGGWNIYNDMLTDAPISKTKLHDGPLAVRRRRRRAVLNDSI